MLEESGHSNCFTNVGSSSHSDTSFTPACVRPPSDSGSNSHPLSQAAVPTSVAGDRQARVLPRVRLASLTAAASLLEALLAFCYLWQLPFQAGFETQGVHFNVGYAFAYFFDFVLLALRLEACVRAGVAARDATLSGGRRTAELAHLVVGGERSSFGRTLLALAWVLPYDAPLWASDARRYVPMVRLTRLLYAIPQTLKFMTRLERSQAVSFTVSRSFRVLHFFFYVTHALGCCLHYFTRRDDAEHYATARWHESYVPGNASLPALVLRSHYWSMMTLTTTGHVDIINDEGTVRRRRVARGRPKRAAEAGGSPSSSPAPPESRERGGGVVRALRPPGRGGRASRVPVLLTAPPPIAPTDRAPFMHA